jgi:hypothetical protein
MKSKAQTLKSLYQFSLLKNALNRVSDGFVIPAEAGIQYLWKSFWVPVCTGMTDKVTFLRGKVLHMFRF